MGALVLSLLAWISAATGYPMPDRPPTVQFVGHQVIRNMMCGGEECVVGAMYRRGGDVVYMDDRLDPRSNVLDSAVLLHELVHFEQERSGRFPGEDCRTWVAEEREAYTLQARWLHEHHRRYPLEQQLPSEDLCPPPAPAGR